MTQKHPQSASRKLAPNVAEPTGLLLGEALLHLSHNRLLRCAARRWVLGVEIVTVAIASYYALTWVLSLALGAVTAYLLLAVAYLYWYGWFINRNRSNKPLCPQCTSRMWQLCCARCREPVPALALWLRGAVLAHCPHCGLRLSCRKKTLLAWCSTCSSSYPRPDWFYNKPTHVIVWIATSLPVEVQGGWKGLPQEDKNEMALYHEGDKHSASIMYIRDDYESPEAPVKEHLINRTRLLLICRDVPDVHAERVKGFFSKSRTLCEKVDCCVVGQPSLQR